MIAPRFDVSLLYYGELGPGTTSRHRYDALTRLARRADAVPTRQGGSGRRLAQRLALHAYRRAGLRLPSPDGSANERLRAQVRAAKPDILWLDKPLDIRTSTIGQLRRERPAMLVAGYSPDDMAQRHNRSATFDELLRYVDIFFTTKSFGVAELHAAGCPRVAFIGNGFDPATHRPIELDAAGREQWGSDVSFVGTYEAARAANLVRLADAGIAVRVWGNGWPRGLDRPNLRIERRPAEGLDFARVACASRINLGFLRKLNRDLQTTRSVELPACGAFMLAERTDEHRALFEEGHEAEFFDDDGELIAKCRRYLADEPARARVAAAGRARCVAAGYRNDDRMAEALAAVLQLRDRHGG